MECARSVYRAEGLAAFYVSYPTTITMTVPFTAVQFSAYEFLKGVLNPDGGYSPMTHVTAGGIAGGIAAAVTTPLDVAKVGPLFTLRSRKWELTCRHYFKLEDHRPMIEYEKPKEWQKHYESLGSETDGKD
jgi:hypothetical protein